MLLLQRNYIVKPKKENADIAVCGFDRIDLDTGKRFSREM